MMGSPLSTTVEPPCPDTGQFEFGPYRFDPLNGTLERDGEEHHLPPRATAVLETLLQHAGDVVSKDHLVTAVWGDTSVTDQSPAEAVRVVRDALQDDPHEPSYIQTVHRRGYRFIAGVDYIPRAGVRQESPPIAPVGRITRSSRRVPPYVVWGFAGLLAGAACVLAWNSLVGSTTGATAPLRVAVALEHPLIPSTPPSIAMAPDGSSVVYRANIDGRQALYLQYLDRFDSAELPGSEGAVGPFFSPDGRWVGFFADRTLMKVSLFGGDPLVVAEGLTGPFGGASWGADDRIVFSRGSQGSLWQVAAAGGTPELLVEPRMEHQGENSYLWPFVADDGSVLFSIRPVGAAVDEEAKIARVRPGSPEIEILLESGGAHPRLLESGQLAFVRSGALFAARLNRSRWQTTSSPEPIVDDLLTISGAAQFGASGTGTIAYALREDPNRRLAWATVDGEMEYLELRPGLYGRHTIAPDGSAVALSVDGDIWQYDLENSASTRLTSHPADEITPIWDPESSTIVFGSNREGPYDLYSVPAAGGDETLLISSEYPKIPVTWTSDGHLLYSQIHPDTGADLWIVDPGRGTDPEPWLRTRFYEAQAALSPDGNWLAYVSNEFGSHDVVVRGFRERGRAVRVSAGGGRQPAWSTDGTELFFSEQEEIRSVRILDDAPLRVSAPRTVAAIPNATAFFAVGGRGERRFLVGVSQSRHEPTFLNLITDGVSLLETRLRR